MLWLQAAVQLMQLMPITASLNGSRRQYELCRPEHQSRIAQMNGSLTIVRLASPCGPPRCSATGRLAFGAMRLYRRITSMACGAISRAVAAFLLRYRLLRRNSAALCKKSTMRTTGQV